MSKNVYELRRDELQELKRSWCAFNDISMSWGEYADIDDWISDQLMFNIYENTGFVEGDFCCNSEEN